MWRSTNIFTRIAILGSSINLLLALPFTPTVYSNTHRLGLPPLPPDTGYSAGFTPIQEFGSGEQPSPSSPSMYHGLDNSQYLPHDVELVPADIMASPSDSRGLVFFSSLGYSAPAPVPYVQFPTNGYQIMPYQVNHKLHNHKHHHTGGHRPLRPERPIHHPSPAPPVWTIPPDVEVWTHEKPSNRPAKPTHAPQPWFPPAIPSYKLASEANDTNEHTGTDTFDWSSRSAIDSGYLADQNVAPEIGPVTEDHMDSQPSEGHKDERRRDQTSDIVADDSTMETCPDWFTWLVSTRPCKLKVLSSNPTTDVVTEAAPSTSTEDSGSQIEPESSDSGFSPVHHAASDVNSSDKDSVTVNFDSDSTEEVPPMKEYSTSNEDSDPHPVYLDMSSFDLPNMEAVLPDKVTVVASADDVTESVSGDQLVEAAGLDASTEVSDWVAEGFIRAGSNSPRSVVVEDADEKEIVSSVISDVVVESETESVPQMSARSQQPRYILMW